MVPKRSVKQKAQSGAIGLGWGRGGWSGLEFQGEVGVGGVRSVTIGAVRREQRGASGECEEPLKFMGAEELCGSSEDAKS